MTSAQIKAERRRRDFIRWRSEYRWRAVLYVWVVVGYVGTIYLLTML